MVHRKTLMETVRQFLAAFADQDQEALAQLLATDVDYAFTCKQRHLNGLSQQEAVQHMLSERTRWQKSRIDIKSWQVENQTVNVTFHVQSGTDIYRDYLEYCLEITARQGIIRQLRLGCEESLPGQVWPQTTSSSGDRLSAPHL